MRRCERAVAFARGWQCGGGQPVFGGVVMVVVVVERFQFDRGHMCAEVERTPQLRCAGSARVCVCVRAFTTFRRMLGARSRVRGKLAHVCSGVR